MIFWLFLGGVGLVALMHVASNVFLDVKKSRDDKMFDLNRKRW